MEWGAIGIDAAKSLLGACAFFWRQPKIDVEYKGGAFGTRAGTSGDMLRCFWNGQLRLYNQTPYDAFELGVELQPSRSWLKVDGPDQRHLKATESLTVRLTCEHERPRSEVNQTRSAHRERALEPAELIDSKIGWSDQAIF